MPSANFSEQTGTRHPASRSLTTEPGAGLKLAPCMEISRIFPATRLRRPGCVKAKSSASSSPGTTRVTVRLSSTGR
jgi:hypothetical protein